jgi:hypothetical protein
VDVEVFPQLKRRRVESGALTVTEASRNCGAATGAALANWYKRLHSGDAGFVTHHAFRLAAGNPKLADGSPSGLSSSNIAAGLKALGVPAERHWGESSAQVPAALELGAAVGLCVDYGAINDLAPALSGQPTFRSGHALVVYGWRWADPKAGGADTLMDHDPIADGRVRPTYTAALQPLVGPWAVFEKALGKFRVGAPVYANGKPIGDGRGVFIIVRPAP